MHTYVVYVFFFTISTRQRDNLLDRIGKNYLACTMKDCNQEKEKKKPPSPRTDRCFVFIDIIY